MYSDYTGTSALAGGALAILFYAIGSAVGELLIATLIIILIIFTFGLASSLLDSISLSFNKTKTLSDVKAKEIDKKGHYQIAYINSYGELVRLGNKLTFIQALAALGITATTNSINKRYSFVYYESKVSSDVKKAQSDKKSWGIYADSQVAAKALATVLCYTGKPEVHGNRQYAHYHDANHIIHIWYGGPVNY